MTEQSDRTDTPRTEILVVDDSRTQVELLRYLLELQHYGVTVALNGQEALDKARERRPDLIVSDIVMPVMDGYEMCAQLKHDSSLSSIPVILLTQLSEPEDIVRGLHAQADYYLTKPYKPDYLLSKVKALLEAPPVQTTEATLSQEGLQVVLDGKSYMVKANRQQMMNLLFSTYENAVQQNRELSATQLDLKASNEQLQEQMKLLHEARAELEEKQVALIEANTKLEALASTDGLTGLNNHRTFKEKLAEYIRYSARYRQEPLSLVLLDVDHFKQYNDTFGHPEGDEVLRRVSRILQQTIRETDFVARYGGEEFVVMMPHTDMDQSVVAAERLRAALENGPWTHRAITASLGIATMVPGQEGQPNDAAFIANADKALYASKHAGRNRWSHSSQAEGG